MGGRWEAEGGLNHLWAQRNSYCVLSKTQKQPQCTCQAKMVPGSCLTPHAALLLRPSGTIWTVMDLQGQKNESRIGYLYLALSLEGLDSPSHKMDFNSCVIMPGFGKSMQSRI